MHFKISSKSLLNFVAYNQKNQEMKKLIFLMIGLVTVSITKAQKVSEKEVPAVVKSVLQRNYPDTNDLKWEKEAENYEAEFEVAENGYSVLIDPSGNIIETEVEISIDTLPADAKSYVAKNYPGKEIKETVKITAVKGTVTYEAEVNGLDFIFDNSGKFLKAVKD